ncbi:hypothetical protein ABMA27_003441 [Loxostege sticticalis]|uniref:Peptidase M14 domain-containing protein n=1 Tax=Loxostege sticticalis TaxID=481309 RepID=A0ABR3HT35_LOXSC
MANLYKRIFVLCVTLYVVCAKHEEYDGHALYQVVVKNAEQALSVNGLENEIPVDVFAYANTGRAGQIRVPKDQKMKFEAILKLMDVEYSILTENIKEELELEDRLLAEVASRPSNRSASGIALPFDQIHRLQVVDDYLVRVANAYPNRVTVESAGRSVEGRDMKYLKISTTNFEDRRKPVIYLMSLLHAREWVTLPGSLYAIEKLVIDVSDQDLVNDFDWIIMPIANPDGYEFSHTGSRFWRKNRRSNNLGSFCMGVDLNRNFNASWGTASSGNPCMETYHGAGPFSEPETANIRRVLNAHRDRIDMFIDLHSFGSMILFGWGNGQLAPNALTLNFVGVQMAQAIDRVKWPSKPNYVVGNIFHVLGYRASGGSSDYAQAGQGIPLSYTYELPGFAGASGINGFLVDPAFIRQAGFETWEGIKAGARTLEYTRRKNLN